jgi:hypothetical protein
MPRPVVPNPAPIAARPVPVAARPVQPTPWPVWIPFSGGSRRHNDNGENNEGLNDWLLLGFWIVVLLVVLAIAIILIRMLRKRARDAHTESAAPTSNLTTYSRPLDPAPVLLEDVHLHDNPLDYLLEIRVTERHFADAETVLVAVPGEGRMMPIRLTPEMRGMVLCYRNLLSKGAGHLYVRFFIGVEYATAIKT